MNISETGCWLSEDLVRTHHFDSRLAEGIAACCTSYQSIIDIGCGDGSYVKYLNCMGFSCIGYDGSPLTPRFAVSLCFQRDFAEPQPLRKADVVLSLEVGEHIPSKYEGVFLDNLIKPKPELIILSWAVEGQAGRGHVNCRNNDYIIAEMERRGYICDYVASETLRAASTLPWFKNTIMVFNVSTV